MATSGTTDAAPQQIPGTLIQNQASAGFGMLEPGTKLYQTSYGYLAVSPSGEQIAYSPSRNIIRAPTELTIPSQQYESGIRPISTYGKESGASTHGYYAPGVISPSAPAPSPAPRPSTELPSSLVGTRLTPEQSLAMMKAPVGTVVDVPRAVTTSGGYTLETSKGTEYFLTKQEAELRSMQLAPKPGEPGYHGTAERPLGIYQPIQPKTGVPLFDASGKPNIRLEGTATEPVFKTDAKYGLMINKDALQLYAQKPQYESSLGIIQAREAGYAKGGFLPFTKEMTVAAETFTRSELLAPKINEMYANLFGTPTEAKAAAQKYTIARAQYYSGLSDKPIDVFAGVATSLPVQAYATGGLFKAGTIATRLSLGGLATGAESAGVPLAPTALRFGAKAVEPATVVGGLGYAGYDIMSAPASERPGKVGVMLAGLPAGVAGWKDASKAYSKFLTIGMTEVPAPIAPEVQAGVKTFPEIKPGTTPGQLLKSFETPKGELAAYHATESYKGKELTVQYPTTESGAFAPGHKGDVPGLYVSPEQYGTSPFFLRVGKYGEFKPSGFLQSEPLSPTVMHIELKGVGRLPKAGRTAEAPATEFLMPGGKAKPGEAYLTTAIERTMKGIGGKREAEAVVSPGTVLRETSARKYFQYEGMNIPIREYASIEGKGISTTTKAPKIDFGSEYLGYKRSVVPTYSYPISGLESLIPIGTAAAKPKKEEATPELSTQITYPKYTPAGDISVLAKYYGINTADVGLFGYEGVTGEGYALTPYRYTPSGYKPYSPYGGYAPAGYTPTGYSPYAPSGYTPSGYAPTPYSGYGGYKSTTYAPRMYAVAKLDEMFKPPEYLRKKKLRGRKYIPKRKEGYLFKERVTPLIEPLAGLKDINIFGTKKKRRR